MDLILDDELAGLLTKLTPPLVPTIVAKVAIGPGKAGQRFTIWEAILSEIVVSDAFGVDRMDYLLRDSLHAGVQYGRFDHHRLVSTLRILPAAPTGDDHATSEPTLGIESGGLNTAESLLLARYFMFSQVYYHPVRLMYDSHLQDFLQAWLQDGRFSVDLERHLSLTDLEVLAAMRCIAQDSKAAGADAANRILNRGHFHLLYERNPGDQSLSLEPGKAIARALQERYSPERVKHRSIAPGSRGVEFPVKMHDGSVVSSTSRSEALRTLPSPVVDHVFVDVALLDDARAWISREKNAVLKAAAEEGSDE